MVVDGALDLRATFVIDADGRAGVHGVNAKGGAHVHGAVYDQVNDHVNDHGAMRLVLKTSSAR